MDTKAVANRLVELCRDGLDQQAVEELYADNIVSIETDAENSRVEGKAALLGKHAWWYDNFEIHSTTVEGPFVSGRDQFAVKFTMDTTPKGGVRDQSAEVAVYTVADGKIVHEEFWYGQP